MITIKFLLHENIPKRESGPQRTTTSSHLSSKQLVYFAEAFIWLSACQSHIFELLCMIQIAMEGTTYCPTTSSVDQLN